MENIGFDLLVRYFFAGVLGFVTVRYFIETVKGYRDVSDSPGWSSVAGVVVTSELHKSWGRKGRNIEADVEYKYMVNGKEYLGTTIKPGFEFSWDTSLPGLNSESRKVEKYPVDTEVAVYYDVDDPERCCIEHRSMGSMILANVISILILSFFLYLFFFDSENLNYSIGF
ncbi:MAG: DUF3592 domain-containing protein [Gammaproteobacteria bacterium]|nr:DUF3592 domain-containing protein [Gammaproteobacteria bacterium]